MIDDDDSIIFQQIDIREKYAVGKHPEFMMYGVTQVRLFSSPFSHLGWFAMISSYLDQHFDSR